MTEINKFEIDAEQDVLEDFYEEFRNRYEDIEAMLAHLDNVPDDAEALTKFYQEISSIKSNAEMCNLAPVLEPLHSLENILERIKANEIKITSGFIEVVLIIMDKVLSLSREAAQTKEVTFSTFNQIQNALQPISKCAGDGVDAAIQESMQVLLGDFMSASEDIDGVELLGEGCVRPLDDDVESLGNDVEPLGNDVEPLDGGVDLFGDDESGEKAIEFPEAKAQKSKVEEDSDFFMEDRDMAIFRIIADTIEFRNPIWRDRDNCIMSIALGMNGIARNPIPFEQIEAAVYMHDFGMLRLSDELFFKTENMSEQEITLLQSHPVIGYEVLARMNGWDEAAAIVFQHQEREDGSGYPEGVTGDKICDGAKILAICDTFYLLMNNYKDQESKRATIRAVAEINSSKGIKFDAKWVDIFNKVVRIQNRVNAI